ncbi:SH3 domain-containing protein [Pilobolus umbonatus]|nr:SH3 domain-containing protein [Pilobolus umbonatus]
MTDSITLCKVEALYPFKSNDPSSLCFNQYDQIDVLNKLPSGWWDGLCNGTRGWFPSNYVKVIDEHELNENETAKYPIQRSRSSKRNNEYRLSLAFNNHDNTQDTKPHWILQKSEDGTTYYYNTSTGDIKHIHEDDTVKFSSGDEDEDDKILEGSAVESEIDFDTYTNEPAWTDITLDRMNNNKVRV